MLTFNEPADTIVRSISMKKETEPNTNQVALPLCKLNSSATALTFQVEFGRKSIRLRCCIQFIQESKSTVNQPPS